LKESYPIEVAEFAISRHPRWSCFCMVGAVCTHEAQLNHIHCE
jgi:hypothetical protein